MEARRKGLADHHTSFAAIDTTGWSAGLQIDYRLVPAEMDGLHFDLAAANRQGIPQTHVKGRERILAAETRMEMATNRLRLRWPQAVRWTAPQPVC